MESNKSNRKWNWIQVILQTPFFWVAVAVVVTAIWTGLKGWFASPYAPLFVPVLLAVVGLTFYAANQIRESRDKKGFSRKTDAEIADILRKWLDKRHYSSRLAPNDKTLFHVVGTDPQKRSLNVFKPKENSSVICISLSMNEKQIEQILPQPHQNIARFRVGIEMARLGLLCHPEAPMRIEQELQCDEFLTESSFWNAIDKIRQGHVLMQAHLVLASQEAKIANQTPTTTEQVPDKKGSQP